MTLNTSFGSISVVLPEVSDYTVDARTSFGGLTTDFPLDIRESSLGTSKSLSGRLGSGACRMSLTNSNGSIEIQKSKAN